MNSRFSAPRVGPDWRGQYGGGQPASYADSGFPERPDLGARQVIGMDGDAIAEFAPAGAEVEVRLAFWGQVITAVSWDLGMSHQTHPRFPAGARIGAEIFSSEAAGR